MESIKWSEVWCMEITSVTNMFLFVIVNIQATNPKIWTEIILLTSRELNDFLTKRLNELFIDFSNKFPFLCIFLHTQFVEILGCPCYKDFSLDYLKIFPFFLSIKKRLRPNFVWWWGPMFISRKWLGIMTQK